MEDLHEDVSGRLLLISLADLLDIGPKGLLDQRHSLRGMIDSGSAAQDGAELA